MPKNGMLARWAPFVLGLALAVGAVVYTYCQSEAKGELNEIRINKLEQQNGETLKLIRQIDRRQVRIMVKLGIDERDER